MPTKNTLDRATATLPKLLYERLEEMGIDFAILYPTQGMFAPHINDEEVRGAACRAFNRFHADVFREFRARLGRFYAVRSRCCSIRAATPWVSSIRSGRRLDSR